MQFIVMENESVSPAPRKDGSSERRAARRYILSLPIELRAEAAEQQESRTGVSRDISFRGMYFTTESNFVLGAQFEFAFTLPPLSGPGTEVLVRGRAKVVRTEEKLEDGLGKLGIAANIEHFAIIRPSAPSV